MTSRKAAASSSDERRLEALQEHFPGEDFSPLQVALAVGRASVTTDRILADRISEHGLTPVALQTLISVLLADEGPIKLSSIGEELRVTKANVSWVLTGLQKQGLVKRTLEPSDGRRIRARLTKKGHDLVQRLVPLAVECLDETFANLGPRERAQLIRLANRIG